MDSMEYQGYTIEIHHTDNGLTGKVLKDGVRVFGLDFPREHARDMELQDGKMARTQKQSYCKSLKMM